MDEAHGHPALQVELLQEVDRRLKQVNDGGDARKEDGHVKEDDDQSGDAANAVEHREHGDEHQAGAAVA